MYTKIARIDYCKIKKKKKTKKRKKGSDRKVLN